jgi:hypothetical protein
VGVAAEAMLFLCIWVLVMALATRDTLQGCVCVVALRGILRSVGLAHSVLVTSELLFFSELSAVTVYDEAAVCNKAVHEWVDYAERAQERHTEVEQEGDAERDNEAYTALVENSGAGILKVLRGLEGWGGGVAKRDCRFLKLVQAAGALSDYC